MCVQHHHRIGKSGHNTVYLQVHPYYTKSSRKSIGKHFRFDFAELTFAADGKRIDLSATEQKLLIVFCNHKGQILERQTLVDKIWSCDSDYIDENALSVTVKRLRDKLGADCIGTVYGMGYVWKGAKK